MSDEALFGSAEKTSLLLRSVLDCLFKIFLFDTQRFLSRERADALMGPLVDQVSLSPSVSPVSPRPLWKMSRGQGKTVRRIHWEKGNRV